MHLTGLILFVGALTSFIIYGYRFISLQKLHYLLKKEDRVFEYTRLILLFICIAISAGMAWG
jgi:hypothetical protein